MLVLLMLLQLVALSAVFAGAVGRLQALLTSQALRRGGASAPVAAVAQQDLTLSLRLAWSR